MDSFQYYFDIKFIPSTFDSYFDKQVIFNNEKKITRKKKTKKKNPVVIHIPTIMEASTLEFKKSKKR